MRFDTNWPRADYEYPTRVHEQKREQAKPKKTAIEKGGGGPDTVSIPADGRKFTMVSSQALQTPKQKFEVEIRIQVGLASILTGS